jgi:hypothetical protein
VEWHIAKQPHIPFFALLQSLSFLAISSNVKSPRAIRSRTSVTRKEALRNKLFTLGSLLVITIDSGKSLLFRNSDGGLLKMFRFYIRAAQSLLSDYTCRHDDGRREPACFTRKWEALNFSIKGFSQTPLEILGRDF